MKPCAVCVSWSQLKVRRTRLCKRKHSPQQQQKVRTRLSLLPLIFPQPTSPRVPKPQFLREERFDIIGIRLLPQTLPRKAARSTHYDPLPSRAQLCSHRILSSLPPPHKHGFCTPRHGDFYSHGPSSRGKGRMDGWPSWSTLLRHEIPRQDADCSSHA